MLLLRICPPRGRTARTNARVLLCADLVQAGNQKDAAAAPHAVVAEEAAPGGVAQEWLQDVVAVQVHGAAAAAADEKVRVLAQRAVEHEVPETAPADSARLCSAQQALRVRVEAA